MFDRYFQQRLKEAYPRVGMKISVQFSTPIRNNWSQFLREDRNKMSLFTVLARKLIKLSTHWNLVVTNHVPSNDANLNIKITSV